MVMLLALRVPGFTRLGMSRSPSEAATTLSSSLAWGWPATIGKTRGVAKQAILLILKYTKILYYPHSSLDQPCKSALTPTKQLQQSNVHLAS